MANLVSPRLATYWAELLDGKKHRQDALDWLELYPRAAAIGLIPAFFQAKGKSQRIYRQALNALKASGHLETVTAVATEYGVELELEPDYPKKVPALPDFWKPELWPRPFLRSNGKAVPLKALESLGRALSLAMPYPYPGLLELRSLGDWGAFLWALYAAWDEAGAPSKHGWAFEAMGHLGDSSVARELSTKLKDWPSQGLYARAVKGLELLQRIGTDEALMYLDELSKKLKSQALRAEARARLEQVANRRGLSQDQLADRLVPTLGLDPDGSALLDLGPRSFRVGFNEHLVPVVFDQKGKLRKSLPTAAKSDDEHLAKQAQTRWKSLKADARKLARLQLERLELAMCCGRRWSPQDFQNFLVAHPLLGHLVRRLVWGVYSDQALVKTFRVAEDRTPADIADEELKLADDILVGLVHPIEGLDSGWQEIFADYELLQPFEQLGRAVYEASPGELEAPSIKRKAGTRVAQKSLFVLKNRGWSRGPVEDGARYNSYYRTFGPELSAELRFYPGVDVASGWEQEQTLEEVTILNNRRPTPAVFSEVVRDLEAVQATSA